MEKNRRDFIKKSGLAFTGLGVLPTAGFSKSAPVSKSSTFNMSGYAAPRMDKIRIGFIGVGNRGTGAVKRMCRIEGVEIKALCDLRAEKVASAKEAIKEYGHEPDLYSGDPEIWRKVCERSDIDLIYILTPWKLHTPMAVFSMNHEKHVCVEVPAAKTIDECWELVETSERTRKHCMMTENCCYDFVELLTLNMARQGFFGEILHCEGGYIHELKELLFSKEKFYQMWELHENYERKGNLYPTHGLGPICQIMNINRGDKMDFLVSVSTNDFSMHPLATKKYLEDSFYKPYIDKDFNGNMSTSIIRTHLGKSIMLQYDVSSVRPYSRIHLVSGTEGIVRKYPEPAHFAKGHKWMNEDEIEGLYKEYNPAIVQKMGEIAKDHGGHGGMDFLMDWRTIDCLRNGLPLDQDVYDAALWSSIGPLSAQSLNNRSNSVDVPDFTRGNWKSNTPIDISMERGGNTKVK